MSHPQVPLTIKHIGDNLAWQRKKRAEIPIYLSLSYPSRVRQKSMTRSIFLFLLLPLIIQRASSGSSCEADLGQDQSDQTDFKVDSDGGGEWKVSLKEMEAKVDQAVAGVNKEVS